jgi:tRNA 2-selenouridine synthase
MGKTEQIQRISIEQYLQRKNRLPIIDVRSPGEFFKGRIPGSVNIPLFSDEERARVGTAYTRESREAALDIGFRFVEPKLEDFIRASRKAAPDGSVAVHCWRGGLRSKAFAGHLADHGFEAVFVIEGGYKSFRRTVLDFFRQPFRLAILGGYTGSGKTAILRELSSRGEQVIDLEALACHKGSAFGSLGQVPQPRNEQFENQLFLAMRTLDETRTIWLEDESPNIGRVAVPKDLFEQMSEGLLLFIDVPVRDRVDILVEEYGQFSSESLARSIEMIQKRLGGERSAAALAALDARDLRRVAEICLEYYDKAYGRSMQRRDPERIRRILAEGGDPRTNAELIINEYTRSASHA